MENEMSALFVSQVQKYPLLTPEQESELADQVQNGSKPALNKLINSNLRLVISVASKFVNSKVPLMDLVQEGSIGLMMAAQKFSSKFKTRFSTYAYPWILQYMLRYVNLHNEIISVPSRREELKKSIINAQNLLYQKNGRMPQNEEIALYLGIEKEKVDDIIQFSYTVSSLDYAENNDGDSLTPADFIADTEDTPEEKLMLEDEKKEICKLMDCLKENERKVLWYRYNFDGDEKSKTLREISLLIGVSPEAVRQTEMRAIKHLKMVISQ